MNADQLRTKLMQFTGELKRQWDKFNSYDPHFHNNDNYNDLQQTRGNIDRYVGTAQEQDADNKAG
jgi:hypothetical protein